jgi:LysR family transcriptional regulator for bpeEF and oprC
MDRLDVMQLFLRVADTGSFSKAARSSGIAQPTASKQIAALEARLGALLLQRTSRGLRLTEAGEAYYESAGRVLCELAATESTIGRGQAAPSGKVRIAISAAFGRLQVVPRLPAFFARYPDLVLDFDVADRHVNLVEDGIDLALRMGHLADSALVARKIGAFTAVTVATPAYLAAHGVPRKPADLAKHTCVAFRFRDAPRPLEFAGGQVIEPRGRVLSNDADHHRASVLAGLGIGQMASWLCAADLAAGTVVPVLAKFTPPPYPVHAVHAAGRLVQSRVRVVLDFLGAICAEEPTLSLRGGARTA